MCFFSHEEELFSPLHIPKNPKKTPRPERSIRKFIRHQIVERRTMAIKPKYQSNIYSFFNLFKI
jgi:hypothetical protein